MIGIVTGGTGGHLFPAQALAEDLLQEGISVCFFGNVLTKNRFFQKDRFPFEDIPAAPLSLFKPRQLMRNLLTIWTGFWKARRVLKEKKPLLLVSFGSFHTFPTLLAAVTLGVPFILFEADQAPGTVTRAFARFAAAIGTFFPKTTLTKKAHHVQMPFRKRFYKGVISKAEACSRYGFTPHLPILCILGGSQGATAINEQVKAMLESALWPYPEIQVLHLTGKEEEVDALVTAYQKQGICAWVAPFEPLMEYAWTAADIAWCRSGASTIAEVIEFEVPALFIPYPHGKNKHQHKNASFFMNVVQGGLVLDEKEWTPAAFSLLAKNLLQKYISFQLAIQQYKQRTRPKPFSELVKEWKKKHAYLSEKLK